jgi:hypothetical protein
MLPVVCSSLPPRAAFSLAGATSASPQSTGTNNNAAAQPLGAAAARGGVRVAAAASRKAQPEGAGQAPMKIADESLVLSLLLY